MRRHAPTAAVAGRSCRCIHPPTADARAGDVDARRSPSIRGCRGSYGWRWQRPRRMWRDWWRRWPDANVGVVTGRVSGIVVLDVDPRSGGGPALGALQERCGTLPATVEVRTGGNGRHLWFSCDEELPSAVLAPGLELKAERSVAAGVGPDTAQFVPQTVPRTHVRAKRLGQPAPRPPPHRSAGATSGWTSRLPDAEPRRSLPRGAAGL